MARTIHHRVKIEELSLEIIAQLNQYEQEVAEQIKKDVKVVAKECVKEIQEKSPKDTGEYQKGWKYKVSYESKESLRITIYNAAKPGLSHLLEFGHALTNGERVDGKEHIYPAQENAKKRLEGKVKITVRRQ